MRTALDDAIATVVDDPPTPRPGPPPAAGRPAHLVAGLVDLPVDQLRPSPNNPRERLTDIEDLASSMRENGLIQPVIARQDPDVGYVIVAGHRRHAAAQRLGWLRIQTIVRKDLRPDDELATMLVENGQRAGLDPIEEARALQRIKTTTGCTDQDLARKVGRSQPTVSARLALLSLPIAQQEQVRAGQMTIGHATHEGRLASGKVRPLGKPGGWHLDHTHSLAIMVMSRCKRLQHGRGRTIGGQGCGACWESVIRADERQATHEHSARAGACAICSSPYSPQVTP